MLFDFDGTLAYMRPSHLALYVQAAAEHGVATTEQAIGGALSAGWERWATAQGVDHAAHSADEASFDAIRSELHHARLAAAGLTGDLPAMAERVTDLEGQAATYHLYDDVQPMLDELVARGLRLVIVSNHVWRLPEIVCALGIDHRFEAVLSSARVGYRKPHPAIYRAAIAAARLQPAELLFIGDSPDADAHGPRAAGMKAVLLDRDPHGAAPDEHSAHDEDSELTAIRSLRELPPLLASQ